jgi:hypothetical protein
MNAQKTQCLNYKLPPILSHPHPCSSKFSHILPWPMDFQKIFKFLANLLKIFTNVLPTLNPNPKP